jgi:hypothetical protein
MLEIEVGGKLMMELTGIPDKLHSFFVGYVKKRVVITMVPLVPDVNRPTLLENLYKGNSVTVRFIRQGTVLGFSTTVAHVAFTPIPLLFLEYPNTIESYNLRKDKRVVCLFPITVVLNGRDQSGALSDISKSGGSIVIPIKDDQSGDFTIDDVIHFRCPLLFGDPQAEVPGKIKRVNKNGTKVELGLKFNDIGDDLARRISEYIEQTRYFMDE